jgi:hypothetical protein
LIPNSPHTLDGIRIDPPPSLPCAAGASPAATAAAAPTPGFGVAGQAELGRRGLAGDHNAGLAQLDHHVVVLFGDVVGEHRGAEREPHPGHLIQVLDRDRDPGKRRQAAGAAVPRGLGDGLPGRRGLIPR